MGSGKSGREIYNESGFDDCAGMSCTLGETEVSERENIPKPLPHKVGKLNYYQARNNDYLRRHKTPPPPDYYLNYGDKYARRFTKRLKPCLSPTGKLWVDRTFVLLQEAIEDKLVASPASFDLLEQDADRFRVFAYATHPVAYLQGGLAKLPMSDLIQIAFTPDLEDLLSPDGIEQVMITMDGLIEEWIKKEGFPPLRWLIAFLNWVKYSSNNV